MGFSGYIGEYEGSLRSVKLDIYSGAVYLDPSYFTDKHVL